MDFDITFANEISAKTPNLCHLAPAGHTYMEDLNEAGGVYAVMNELNKKNLLYTECMTVTGKTVGENIEGCVNKDPDVIRQIENPYSETGGLAVLTGNLAPHGGVVKRSAVVEEMMVHEGPARVFDCEEDAIAAIKGGKIVAGDVVVIRNCRYGTRLQCGVDYGWAFQWRIKRCIHRTRVSGSSSGRSNCVSGRRRYH